MELVCIVCSLIKLFFVVNLEDLDVFIVSGGFGVVKNFSDFVIKGFECVIDLDLVKLI